MDPQLKATLDQTIYVAAETGRDDYGDASWGTPAAVSARVEQESRVIDTPDGQKRQTTHVVITETAVAMTSRVWLPGVDETDDTLARRPVGVDICPDEDSSSVHHYETRL